MATWLDVLSLEIANMSPEDVLEPQTEVDEEDHEVGVASEEMQRLYSVAMDWERQAAEAIIAARYGRDREQQSQHVNYAEAMREKSSLVMNIFWIELKDQFGLWDKPSIGIRKGWRVVWTDRPQTSLIDALGPLFGG